MASIVDGYCCLKMKSSPLWTKVKKEPEQLQHKISSDINRKSFDHYHLNLNKSLVASPVNRAANSVHILSESEDSKETSK